MTERKRYMRGETKTARGDYGKKGYMGGGTAAGQAIRTTFDDAKKIATTAVDDAYEEAAHKKYSGGGKVYRKKK